MQMLFRTMQTKTFTLSECWFTSRDNIIRRKEEEERNIENINIIEISDEEWSDSDDEI